MLSILTLVLTVSLAQAVLWPKGTYTLVKPKSGCPYGWKEGWRHQDNEDSRNSNSIPPNHQFYGTFGRNMQFYYCTKDAHSTSGSQNWPRGNYCILKQISCPPGFETGYIKWDDEDSRNANSKGGVLPSGNFDRNTLIYYCCRSDGYYMNGIDLPKNKPFYLLRYTSPCQRVKGMSVLEHAVFTDDEDKRNANGQGGSHPLKTGGKNTKLYYCYYQKY